MAVNTTDYDNPLLTTSGKETVPFEYQAQEREIAHRKALARQMTQKAMGPKAAPERFGIHVANTAAADGITQALHTYIGMKGEKDADSDYLKLASKMEMDKQAEIARVVAQQNGAPARMVSQVGPPMEGQDGLPDIPAPAVPGDVKGAIAQAMLGKFPDTRALGTRIQTREDARQKHSDDMLGTGAKLLAETNPQAALQFFQNGDPKAIVPPPVVREPVFSKSPQGDNVVTTMDMKTGRPVVQFAPKEPKVNVNTKVTTGDHTDVQLDKVGIEMLQKKKDEAADAQNVISSAIRSNKLLNMGADAGGGASVRQSVRVFAQAFGVDIPVTGMTEELRMRLGENILAQARKLAPVTGNDVVLLQQLLGSIDTDPNALREVNSLMLAKGLMTQDLHNKAVEDTRVVSSGDPRKYDPFKIARGNIDTQDPALLGRAYQLMKESGHDMSGYKFDGKPVNEINLNIGFTGQNSADNKPKPPSGILRK